MIALTAGILFLVYLNAPAVAVRMHGAPFLLAAAVPLALAIPVAHRVVVRGEPLLMPAPIVAGLAMLGLHAVSAVFSVRPYTSLDHLSTWLLEGVLLGLLIANAVRTRDEVRAAFTALLAAGAVMGTVALLQQTLLGTDWGAFGFGQLDSAIVDDSGRAARRLAGPIGETNRFAQIMAVLIPIGAGLAVALRGGGRWLCWGATALVAIGMAFAFSRGAIVALALAVPLALRLRLLRWRELVAAVALGGLLLAFMPHYAARVASLGEIAVRSIGLDPAGLRNADGAARGRLTEMRAAGMLFLDHPILGAGPGLAPLYYADYATVVGGKVRPGERRSHNLYLQLAAETGLVGLGAFLAVVAVTLRALDRARRRFESTDRMLWGLAVGLQLGLVVSLLTSLFLHAAYIRYFWILIGLAAAVSAQPGAPALVAFLSRALRETAERLRRDEARA